MVTGYAEEGYILKVYDAQGNLIRKITKDTVPIEITREDVEARITSDPLGRNLQYDIPKYFPPFRWLMLDDEDRIWVYTWERTPDKKKTYFDVFSKDGIFIAKIPLKSRPHVVKNNKIYNIEEDEEGFQRVKCYTLTWKKEN